MRESSRYPVSSATLCFVTVAFVLWLAVLATPVAGQELILTVAGLQVVLENDELNTTVLGTTGGSKIALLVRRTGGGIISFDEDSSTLASLTDNLGRSLLGEGSFSNGFGSFPTIEDNGARLLVVLESSGVPGPGAKSIQAKGSIMVSVAETSETYRSPKVMLETGAEVKAGPIPLRVSAVGPPEWGDAELAVTLVADQEIDEIKVIRMLGADGSEIEFDTGSSGSMNMMGRVTVTREFTFPEKQEAVIVEVEYWTGLRRVEVPFDFAVGVGF